MLRTSPSVLADTGPLVALFDKTDHYHAQAMAFIGQFEGGLVSNWVVVTEVCYLLEFSVAAQLDFLRWIAQGGLKLVELEEPALQHIPHAMDKYRDRPMDLADASLMVLSMQTGIRDIITFDSDFDFYRLPDRSKLKNQFTQMRKR
ncbi:MAG: PIN domain-containing protein [Hydrogenophilales bacterium]|nr:PIN domain-containing protein [Hydrogenophilales bacterium]